MRLCGLGRWEVLIQNYIKLWKLERIIVVIKVMTNTIDSRNSIYRQET